MSDDLVVPDGWTRTTLGEIGRYLNGRAFKSSEWSKTGRPIIRIQDLTGTNRNPNFFQGKVDDRYVVRAGDFLISWSATLGAYIWDGPEAVLNQHIFKVESFIDKRFHYHLVRERIGELERHAHGSGMVHVTKGIFDETPVAVPETIDVQRLVADMIDQADALRDSSAAHLANARRAVGQFRQAILAAAFRQALARTETESPVSLATILREPLKNGYSARPVNHETQSRVLTLTATTSGNFDGRHFKYTDEVFEADSPFWLRPGDILIQRGNTAEYVGVPALYEGMSGEYIYPDLMIRVRVREGVDPRFIWYMLLAPQTRQYVRERATGSAGNMPKINQKVVNDVPLPVPDADECSAIVALLDVALAVAATVESRIDAAAGRVNGSSQAILAKAFRGEFVSTDQVAVGAT